MRPSGDQLHSRLRHGTAKSQPSSFHKIPLTYKEVKGAKVRRLVWGYTLDREECIQIPRLLASVSVLLTASVLLIWYKHWRRKHIGCRRMSLGTQQMGRRPKTNSASQLCLGPALVSALAQEIPSYKQSHIPKVHSCLFLELGSLSSSVTNNLNVFSGELVFQDLSKALFNTWSTWSVIVIVLQWILPNIWCIIMRREIQHVMSCRSGWTNSAEVVVCRLNQCRIGQV